MLQYYVHFHFQLNREELLGYSDTQMLFPYMVKNVTGHSIVSMTIYPNYFEFYYGTSGNSSFPLNPTLNLGFNGFTVSYTSQN